MPTASTVTISSTPTAAAGQRKAAIRALLVNCSNPGVVAAMIPDLTLTMIVTWLNEQISQTENSFLAEILAYVKATLEAQLTPAQAKVAALEETLAVVTG